MNSGSRFRSLTSDFDALARAAWLAAAFSLPMLLVLSHKATVILLSGMAGIGGVWLWRRRAWSLTIDRRVLTACAVFLAWGGASVVWEVTPGLAWHKALQLVALLGVAQLVLAFASATKSGDDSTAKAFLTGMAVAMAFIAVEWVSGCAVTVGVGHLFGGEPRCVVPRYKTAMTASAVLAVPFACRWLFGATPRLRIVGLGLLAAFFAMAMVTKGTSAVVAVPVGVVTFALVRWYPRAGTVAVAAVVVAMTVLAPVVVRQLPTPAEAYEIGMPNSMYHRLLIWGFATDRIFERPVAGWGLDGSREIPGGDQDGNTVITNSAGKPIILAQQLLPLHPHNFALQVWLETGAVGIALFTALLLTLITAAAKGAERADRATRLSAIAVWVSVSLVSYGVWQSWWLAAVLLMVSMLIRLPRKAG